MTVNQWEPKNDLGAYAAQRKTAWGASGFQLISEEAVTLAGGRQAMAFVIETADKLQVFFLFTTLGNGYLEVSGDGDLNLVREMALTVRPLGGQ